MCYTGRVSLEPTRCYRALLSRDRRFDGRFFVGVTSTGIYCRPICPSPPPRQRNVRFYACAAAAEAAGFRPCLRCRPETAPGTPAWTGSAALVTRALRLIADGALDEDDTESLALRLGVSGRHLRRLFDAHLGAAPGAVARATRVHLARRLLDETDLRMVDVAISAGFASVRQFNHAIRATFRESPRALRGRRRRDVPAGLRLRLAYRPPLDWTALLGFLALRAIPGVEVVDGTSYRRTVAVGSEVGTLSLRPLPDTRAGRADVVAARPRRRSSGWSRAPGACSTSTPIRTRSAARSGARRSSPTACADGRACAFPGRGIRSSSWCAPCWASR